MSAEAKLRQLVEANLDWVTEEYQLLYAECIKDPGKAGSIENCQLHSDTYSWQACVGKLHERDFEVFEHFAAPENLVIDVGANFGQSAMSIWATGSEASVWSFEALRVHQTYLEKIREAFQDKFDFRMVGLGDKEDQLTIFIPAINNICVTALASASEQIYWPAVAEHTIRAGGPSVFTGNRTPKLDLVQIKVPVTTLDAILESENPSVRGETLCAIKIDVEGLEPQVIEGARRTLDAHKPLLLIESGQHYAGLPEALSELGYEMAFYRDGVLKESNAPSTHLNAFFWHVSKEQSYRDAGLLASSGGGFFSTFKKQARRLKNKFSRWSALS